MVFKRRTFLQGLKEEKRRVAFSGKRERGGEREAGGTASDSHELIVRLKSLGCSVSSC